MLKLNCITKLLSNTYHTNTYETTSESIKIERMSFKVLYLQGRKINFFQSRILQHIHSSSTVLASAEITSQTEFLNHQLLFHYSVLICLHIVKSVAFQSLFNLREYRNVT